MKDLREQALKLVTSLQSDIPTRTLREMPQVFPDWLAQIESFAREIRNEALEEAANVTTEWQEDWNEHQVALYRAAKKIRALKDPCILAACVPEDT